MIERKATPGSGWRFHLPFLVGDGLLLLAAWLLFAQAYRPMLAYEVLGVALCVAAGCTLGVWPWVLEHRAGLKRLEIGELAGALARLQQVEEIARQISLATGKWQTAHDAAEHTVRTARELADRMTAEQTDFRLFLEKAHDTERQHLRLEVEKLRRNEGAWVQILVFLLDHTYALYLAATRSGQDNVIQQIGRFQSACLEAVRRVGLTSLVVPTGTPFDPESHHLPEDAGSPPEQAVVVETLAPGYSLQGRLLRQPLVRIEGAAPSIPADEPDLTPASHPLFDQVTSPAFAHPPHPGTNDADPPASPS